MTALRRILVFCLAVAATLLVLLLCAYLSAPLWIDSGTVKGEIARLVERATGNPVRIEQLRMRLFPPVGVEVANPGYRSAGVDVQARAAVIDLEFWPLLTGRVQPRLVQVSGLKATVSIPASAPDAPSTSVQEIDRRLREALSRLSTSAPGLDVEVEDAALELRIPDKSTLALRDLRVRAAISEAGITGTVEGAASVWERALVEFSLSRDLDGRGRVEFVALDVAALLAWLPAAGEWEVDEAKALGRADWRMKGLANLDAEFTASVPRVAVRHGNAGQAFSGIAAAGSLEMRGPALALRMDRLFLREPRLMLSGEYVRDEQARHSFRLQGGDIDLTQMLAVARVLAPDAGWVSRPPIDLHAGTLAVDLRGSASGLPQLFDIASLQGELRLEDAAFDLRRPSMRFTRGAGLVELDHGAMHARGVRATLGQSVLRLGTADVDLGDEPRLRRAEALIDLDLAEAADFAKRVLTDKGARAHLDALENIEGRALAQVRVSESRRGLRAAVDLSQIALLVRHRSVPLPLRVTDGRLSYSAEGLAINGVAGAFGRSPFEGLEGTLQLQPPFAFQLRQRQARVALEEIYPALRRIPAAAPALGEIQALTGSVSLKEVQANGGLDALEATRFRAILVPHAVKTLVTRLETDLLLDGGEVEVTEQSIALRDVGAASLDSSLRVSAGIGNYRKDIQEITATVNGDVGPETLGRIEAAATLPAAWKVRTPLQLTDTRLDWNRGGSASLLGKVRVAGSTELDIDARKSPEGLKVQRARIRDAASDATISLALAGDSLGFTFKGHLAGATLAHVFLQPPVSIGHIEGDMAADLHFQKPWIVRAQGRLEGAALAIPMDATALKVDRAALTADGTGVTIEEAAFSFGDNRAGFKGTVRRVGEKLILDADLRADRIELPELLERTPASEDGKPFALSDLPVAGRLGLDIGHLEAEKLTIAPLVADARLDGELLDLRIERAALCNITMSGTLKGRLADMRLEGSLASRQADVEKSIACLTSGRVVLSGRLDLDARFTASGPLGRLARHLDGSFTAKAVDGRIEQFDTLNRVFAFLNLTEVMRGEKIQLGEKGLPYRTVDVKGTLAGETVHVEEMVMDAPTVHIAAAGNVDYGTGRMGMDVLVAPLQTANVLLSKIPLMKRIFGGSVLALPVRVTGTVQSPIVVPLGPGSVARRMTSIIANTLRLPLDAIEMVTPTADATADPQ